MRQDELRAAARMQPFEPFRLLLTTGATYDIRHPDLIMVGRRSIIVGIPSPEAPTVYDRTIKIDLLHVVGIEDLANSTPSPPTGAG